MDDALAHHGVLDEGLNFLEKPCSPSRLLKKVRAVLDTPNTLLPSSTNESLLANSES